MKKWSFIISCVCMVLGMLGAHELNIGSKVYVVNKRLDKLPHTIERWNGQDVTIPDSVVNELNTDVYVYRYYRYKGNEPLLLYIGYYGTHKGGRSEHSPEGCYPGAGWAILEENKDTLEIVFNGKKRAYTFNVMQVLKDNRKQLIYYWYQTRGLQVISSGIEHNLCRFKSRILYSRDDGAFIRVSIDMQEDLVNAKSRIEDFIRAIIPIVVEYWPIEQEM